MREHIEQFRDAVCKAGLNPPEDIEPDGKLHRFTSNGKRNDDAGWYVLHADGIPAGAFGDWRGGLSETWRADIGRRLSPQEEAEHRARVEAMRREREAEDAKRKAEAREKAALVWQAARPAPDDHGYLLKKGVKAHGLRVHEGALVIPMRDGSELHSLQFIGMKGDKRFLTGGRMAGCYFSIGDVNGAVAVCICEGFATGASIHEATDYPVVVAFNAGNLGPVARVLRARFPNSRLILCADDDAATDGPGLPKATEAARSVGGRLAVPAFGPDRPEWASDFNDMHRQQGLEAVAERIRRHVAAHSQDRTPPGPRPLQREIPPSTPFPIDALGKVLGDASRKMQAIIQAPAAICGNSLLAGAGLAVQAHADVVIDGRVFPISEMFVTVGQTGERKSEADKVALRPLREYERTLADKYGQDMLAYQCDHEAYEKAKQEVLGSKQNKSYEAKRRGLAELGEAPVRPLEPLLLCEEPTYEGLVKLLAVGQPSVGLFSDEGGRFIGGHGMNSDNLLKTAAGLSGLWDGKPIDRVRVGDGSTKLYGRRVSFHLMVQPEVSQLMLSNPVLIGQGLLSRCLVTWPESTAGTRLYFEGDLSTSREIAAYNTLMKGILETMLPLADGARNELAPRRLQPAPDAKRLWVKFHDHVERQLAEGGTLASVRGLGNKAPEHAARLAGVLALVKDIHVAHIGLEHMKAGIALVTHYLNEALRLYEAGVQDPQLSLAQKLLGWLKGRGQPGVTLPEIYQLGPRPIRNARMARLLMGILEEHAYVQAIKEGSEHREAWSIRL